TGLEDLIARHLPETRVSAEPINGSIVLTGNVNNASEAAQVLQLVELYETANVVNMLSVAAEDQVLLEVRIVEMSRTFLKQLGIRPDGNTSFGDTETVVEGDVLITDPATGLVTGTGTQAVPSNRSLDANAGFEGPGFDGGFGATLGFQNFVGSLLQSEVNVDIDALERIG
ncbi:MAG: type II and III secretion system protein family protein, partial [Pseudomonadota bacterium]